MKTIFVITALLFATPFVQAKTVCHITTSTAQDEFNYNQSLLALEVNTPKYVIIKKGKEGVSARELQLNELQISDQSSEKLKAFEGATFASLDLNSNPQGLSVTVWHIDLTKKSKAVFDAAVVGASASPLVMLFVQRNFGVSCRPE